MVSKAVSLPFCLTPIRQRQHFASKLQYKPQTNTDLPAIAEVLRVRDNFVICAHVSPDGDAIGSQLALWHALRSMGKKATCVLVRDEPIAASEAFMPGVDQMIPAERFEGKDARPYRGCSMRDSRPVRNFRDA